MTDAIVSLTRLAPDRLEVGIRRGAEVFRYELTEVPSRVAPVLHLDKQFHRDYSRDIDARMQVLRVARRAFRGEDVPLPVPLPESPA